jgi:hypothetical protein
MGRPIFPYQARAVKAENNGQFLYRNIMDDHVVRSLHKRGIDIATIPKMINATIIFFILTPPLFYQLCGWY